MRSTAIASVIIPREEVAAANELRSTCKRLESDFGARDARARAGASYPVGEFEYTPNPTFSAFGGTHFQAAFVAATAGRATGEVFITQETRMLRNTLRVIGWGNAVLIAVVGAAWPIQAQDSKAEDTKSPYPRMAPVAQYRMDRDAEIALARTAAPASISRDAEVLVLGQKNFETAVHGKNGFVCLVGRAFAGPLTNPEFWNPKNRSPICLNPPAARSLMPYAMKQAGLALAGASKAQITDAIRTGVAKKELGPPELGSMAYMMSKEAYLTDRGDHNLAHVMFELPRNGVFQDNPNFFVSWDPAPVIEFNVPVGQWSDGTEITPQNGHASDETAKRAVATVCPPRLRCPR